MPEKIVTFDIETDGLLGVCTRTWVLCIGVPGSPAVTRYTDYDPVHRPLREGVARLLAAERVVAHNGIGFDIDALRATGCITEAEAEALHAKLIDTLVLGRLFDPERPGGHALENYGVEVGLLKGKHDDWTCYSEAMGSYCETDVAVTNRVYEMLAPVLEWGRAPWIEHRVARLIELQMRNGFLLNVQEATKLAASLYDERARLTVELQRVFPPILVAAGVFTPKRDNAKAGYVAGAPFTKLRWQEFNPASEHHVARRLKRKYGWTAPLTEKGNPNITEAVLKKLDYPEVELLLRFVRVDKQWSQIAAPPKKRADGKSVGGGWIHHADENNRVHGYVNSNGAVTGRMTHSRPNSANIDKDGAMRALWIPREGWVLVGCDAEGLELRMLAHYLARLDGGAFARTLLEGKKEEGTDAHSKNQRAADLASRDGAKTTIYGLIYGAGDPKLGAVWVEDWNKSGKPKEEWPQWAFKARGKQRRLRSLKDIGAEVRKRLETGITGFGDLVREVKALAKKRKWLKGLDGRRLRCRKEHAALNTLLQGGGAIVMKLALILFHDTATARGLVHGEHFAYCANVHDEVQIECMPEHAEWIGKTFAASITEAGNQLGVRCRLDGAYAIGANWNETH